MRILITSGGTRIPIDRVRSITNMSRGTFGANIAEAALEAGHELHFLAAEGSQKPFQYLWEPLKGRPNKDWHALESKVNSFRSYYRESMYKTYTDYARQLESLLRTQSFDAVILAAAVSDYGIQPYEGKVQSRDQLTLVLSPLPKLIHSVKEWDPRITLVGFKLLVDSTEEALLQACRKSIRDNHCDVVVANDLRDIQRGEHRLFIVKASSPDKASSHTSNLPHAVMHAATHP